MARIALFGDVHGNVLALEAVRDAVRASRPDAVMIAGDLVLNGPAPAETIDLDTLFAVMQPDAAALR